MKRFVKTFSSAALAVTLGAAIALTGCGTVEDDTYTYREYISASPTSWNSHIGTSDADTYVQGYTEIGLYDITFNDDYTSFAFSDEMAAGDPQDVTASYAGQYGIKSGDSGKAYKISLNPSATWANGTPITSADYVYSMKQLLNPDMKNSKAAHFYEGTAELYNAKNYYGNTPYIKIDISETYNDKELRDLAAAGKLYFSLDQIYLLEGGYTLKSWYDWAAAGGTAMRDAIYSCYYENRDTSNECILDLLSTDAFAPNAAGYVQITEDNFEYVKDNIGVFFTNVVGFNAAYAKFYGDSWYYACAVRLDDDGTEGGIDFNQVGIKADGDYGLVLIFENSLTALDVKYQLTTPWLVYEEYYEEGKATIGELVTTNYGTSSGKYMAYGPYVLSSYQKDKELVFERNESWYGYQEGATNYHAGQYQTDRIVTQVISQQSTALLEFESGNLDQVRLSSTDLDKYKFSDYLLTHTGGNIWQIVFNSDAAALAGIEAAAGDGANRQILSVTEFRKAISLSLNRYSVGREIAGGSSPAFFYLNGNYYYDMENDSDSIYRNTDEAMQAIVDLYGIEYGAGKTYTTLKDAYNAITGYDLDEAKEYFSAAYDIAIAQGLYTAGQNVKINIYTNNLTAQLSSLSQYIQTQVTAATQGTALEGKITIEFKEQASGRNEDLQNGLIEASYYSTIADYNDPAALLGNYTSKTNTYEYGFDPSVETFDITYDFNGDGVAETETKTYEQWQKSVSAGGAYANDTGAKLTILARLEYNILNGFRTLPLYVGTDVLLYSKKVNFPTTNANIYAGYGGVRFVTYNYSDSEWTDYLAKNTLDYTE